MCHFLAEAFICRIYRIHNLQALTEIQKQMGSLHAELKDTNRGSEDMQQAICIRAASHHCRRGRDYLLRSLLCRVLSFAHDCPFRIYRR